MCHLPLILRSSTTTGCMTWTSPVNCTLSPRLLGRLTSHRRATLCAATHCFRYCTGWTTWVCHAILQHRQVPNAECKPLKEHSYGIGLYTCTEWLVTHDHNRLLLNGCWWWNQTGHCNIRKSADSFCSWLVRQQKHTFLMERAVNYLHNLLHIHPSEMRVMLLLIVEEAISVGLSGSSFHVGLQLEFDLFGQAL